VIVRDNGRREAAAHVATDDVAALRAQLAKLELPSGYALVVDADPP